MRYYAIKISGASGGQTPSSTTQGAAGGGSTPSGAAPTLSSMARHEQNPASGAQRPQVSGLGSLRTELNRWHSAPSLAAPADGWTPDAGIDWGNLPNASNTPAGGNITVNKAGAGTMASWTSEINGVNDPGALDIAFTIELVVGQADTPSTASVTVWGIPIQTISQASNFNNCTLELNAGYGHGLPLAELQYPHRGLILKGNIFPCYGNWISNNTSIEFIVTPSATSGGSTGGQGGPTNIKNIIHNMPPNTPLSTAIRNALTTAFPGAQLNINISPKLVLTSPDWSFHQSLSQYANYLKSLSHSILGTPNTTGYAGVGMALQGDIIQFSDGTTKGNAIPIIYEDLVGQPTWIGANRIQVTTLLRGDIGPQSSGGPLSITLTPTLTTMGADTASWLQQGGNIAGLKGDYLTFQGTWDVQTVRHIGKFRDPQWNAWITIIEAIQNGGGSGAQPSGAANTGGQQTFTNAPGGPGTAR